MSEDRERDLQARELEDVASATECTGLVPALESADSEASLRALYGVHRARRPGRMYEKKR